MLAKTERGGLIKIRVDMLSERPGAMTNYCLQGTKGCYESARKKGDPHRIWLADLCEEKRWKDLLDLEADYMPEMWRSPSQEAMMASHGGGDNLEDGDFIKPITSNST